MRVTPPFDGTLDTGSTENSKEQTQWPVGRVRSVSPQSVVTSSDGNTTETVIDHREDEHFELQWHTARNRIVQTNQWNEHHKSQVQPVQMQVPVIYRPWHLTDVLPVLVFLLILLVLFQKIVHVRVCFEVHIHHILGPHQLTQPVHNTNGLLVGPCGQHVGTNQIHLLHGICYDYSYSILFLLALFRNTNYSLAVASLFLLSFLKSNLSFTSS